MSSSKNIRLMRSSVIYGPFSADQLRHMASTQKIKSTDLVSVNNGPWKPIKLSANEQQQKPASQIEKPKAPAEASSGYKSRENTIYVSQNTIESINKWSCAWSNSTIPKNIMNNSKIIDYSVKEFIFVILTLNYRNITGSELVQPCNKTRVNTDNMPATLFESRPDLDDDEQEKSIILQLGNIRSCPKCRGSGEVKCGSCNGAGKKKCGWCDGHGYKRSANNETTPCTSCSRGEINCHCGNGRITCNICSGYGSIKDIFRIVEKNIRHVNKFTNYNGCIPEKSIIESTGTKIYGKILEFPIIDWQDHIENNDAHYFEKILSRATEKIKRDMSNSKKAENYIAFINTKVDEFACKMPNPTSGNIKMKNEILPISIDISVEQFNIEQINIRYKSRKKLSTLYVFGNELCVHAENMPFAITPRLLAITLLYLIAFSCCCVFPGRIIYNKNNENTPEIPAKKIIAEPRFVEPRAPQKLPDPPKAPARIEVESPKREDKK